MNLRPKLKSPPPPLAAFPPNTTKSTLLKNAPQISPTTNAFPLLSSLLSRLLLLRPPHSSQLQNRHFNQFRRESQSTQPRAVGKPVADDALLKYPGNQHSAEWYLFSDLNCPSEERIDSAVTRVMDPDEVMSKLRKL
ncbi:putative arabinosyltransferase ARAD1 [Salvia divinorum]|uniref:Arabinosyltransferase ARAD1 n=1 Tax=Salvia divinorum TaxID=28513 RepID=A0ABD1IIC8_SALDI